MSVKAVGAHILKLVLFEDRGGIDKNAHRAQRLIGAFDQTCGLFGLAEVRTQRDGAHALELFRQRLGFIG